MSAALAADAVLLLHALFVAWVVCGGIAVLFRPVLAWLHLPALAWGAWIEFSGGVCPLTPLEQRLRRAAGEAGYEGGFVEHYVTAALYPDGLTREVQVALGALLVAFNAALYARLVFRSRR